MQDRRMLSLTVLLVGTLAVSAVELTPGENGAFGIGAERVRITVRNARIVGVASVASGRKLVDPANGVGSLHAGLGNMRGKEQELSRVHFPWGEPNMPQHKKRIPTDLYRYPDAASELALRNEDGKVVATWRNLTDGAARFAQDTITLVFASDEQGALTIGRAAVSPDLGVFGINLPVENLGGDGKILLPSFGGIEYDACADEEQLMGFQDTTLFFEAPLMIYTRAGHTMAIWVEDATFRPHFGLIERTPRGATMAIEALNLIPYETNTTVTAPALKLDLFADSDWVAAARPYRDWYQRTFAKEIALRESSDWAKKIYAIAHGGYTAPGAEQIATLFKPENVLIQIWNPRKYGFTQDVPDYTPREGYPEAVKRLHELGHRVMCYVCSLCAVYRSPAWDRDGVGDFFLTRKNSINNYNGNENAFDENLTGTIRAARGQDQYADLKPGAFLYGDPLAAGWRRYFVHVIREMNERCGTDANYQDTLGCSGDVGNGVVDGLSGAQGNTAFTRELQTGLGVPMASEFGPAPIAFGVRWPLNLSVVWGNAKFRAYRAGRQHPVTAFLFGYRTWVAAIRQTTDELKYNACAVSDALSGFGMFMSHQPMRTTRGFDDHLVWRAKVFADNRLEPYYPEKKYPEKIRAMYQDHQGRLFPYFDDGMLQKLIGPDGRALYGRLHGAATLKTADLMLPGWPVRDATGIYGLNPESHYALFPVTEQATTRVRADALPDGVALKTYYETLDFAYLELIGQSGDACELTLRAARDYAFVTVNDHLQAVDGEVVVRGKLPLRLVFTNGKNTRPETVRKISQTSGLEDGEPEQLGNARNIAGRLFYSVNGFASKHLDYIHAVKAADEALDFKLVNTQTEYGDGSIVRFFINGTQIRAFDCHQMIERKSVFDTRIRNWRIPIGHYAGKPVLVTVAVDYKDGSNADMQFVTRPRLVTDPAQVFAETIIEQKPAAAARPAGKPLATIVPGFGLEGPIKPAATRVAVSKDVYAFDPGRRYFLSGEFKGTGTLYFGAVEYDARGEIHGVHVNGVEDSETALLSDAPAGSETLSVRDAENWPQGGLVALDAEPDRSDLPNRRLVGPVAKADMSDAGWTVHLEKPLPEAVAAGTKLRVHMPTSTFHYVKTVPLKPDAFAPAAGMVSPWPGATKFRALILNSEAVEFKNLKIEVFGSAD